MPYFNSSAIIRAEYNGGRLTIWFPAGHSYDYCGVPEHVWQGLLNAASKGTYFNIHIADRYSC